MEFNFEIVKRHPLVIGGGLLAVLVILYLSRRSGSSGMSGTSQQLGALNTAADLANAQTNAQITGAAYQAGVINNQTAAQLQLGLAQTAAELDATNKQTTAAEVVALSGQQAAVTAQSIISAADVQKTAIASSTIEKLATTSAQLQRYKINSTIGQQNWMYQLLASKGKLGGDSTGVAQILSALQGRGPEAIAANQPTSATSAAQPGVIARSAAGFLGGLFGA